MKTQNKVQKLYEERASLYQRLFVDFLGWGRELEAFFQRSEYLHPNSIILDAGCGTGIITRVLFQLARENGYAGITFHAFDLTQNMLKIFQEWIAGQEAHNIELQQADVLKIEVLPSHWKEYDLIVSSTMLEYLPKPKLRAAVSNLEKLLAKNGTLLIFMTRRNLITRLLAGAWWKANLYNESQIKALFHDVGFDEIEFQKFSPAWSNSIMVVQAKKVGL